MRFGKTILSAIGAGVAALALLVAPAIAQPTIKIAYTGQLSGPAAQVGDAEIKQMRYIIDLVNAKGGALGRRLELVPFDNKSQPADALIALKNATDQNMSFIVNCGPSNVSAALIDGVNKHNERNPDNRIIYLNCGGVATELTNDMCSFWHFRFDLNVTQKVEAMVKALPKTVTRVYLLNQDYLFGQSVQRDVKIFLARHRPDVQVVGDELIPLLKVQDFSPYITKIKASGAQALLTGNWGPDMNLLIKAGLSMGIDVSYYTFYAHLAGGPSAIGSEGDGKVFAVMAYGENVASEIGNMEAEAWASGFRAANNFDFIGATVFRATIEHLVSAINKAGSLDAFKVASAMEGQRMKDFLGFDNWMRADDHQLHSAYYVGVFQRGVKYDSERTGLGWKTATIIKSDEVVQPTSCRMRRPRN
jgi:branched-chain amino acid transport system substrate-binding protein